MDPVKFILSVLKFFSQKRTLDEVIKQFGPARNSLEADIISLKPIGEDVAAVEIFMDQRAMKPAILSIEFTLSQKSALTVAQLAKLFPNDIESIVNREHNIHTFHPDSSFVESIEAEGYDPVNSSLMQKIEFNFKNL